MASGNVLAVMEAWDDAPPTSSFPQKALRNGRPALAFAEGESTNYEFHLPEYYDGGGLTIDIYYSMASATANNVSVSTAIERTALNTMDTDADDFASAVASGDVAVPTTSGRVEKITQVHDSGSEMDGATAGEMCRLKVSRTTPSGTAATGDMEIRRIVIKET